jgi:dihydrolipoamide dehydrogenase
MQKYDLAIIGSGPGGYSAAMRALDLKKHICIIEKSSLGGAGILNGALSSKTLWHLSEDFDIASRTDRGYRANKLTINFEEVVRAVRNASKNKIYQLKSQIETFTYKHFPDRSLTLKHGFAKLLDNHTIEITKADKKEIIKTDYILIATGSRPREYPGLQIDGKKTITSDHIMRLKNFPERLLIVGSGIIGTEFATIFSNFKQTEVHLLDRQHRVIPFEDNDVSDFVSHNLEKNGVIIHHKANLRTIKKNDEGLEVILDYADGHTQVMEVDMTLVSIGRVSNTENLGLENLGIELDQQNNIIVDKFLRVKNNKSYKNIFAAGDVTGESQLYSVAEMQGRFAILAMFDKAKYPLNYHNMPTLMFFKPELAAVGYNEKQLQQMKIPYKMAFYSNKLINRALAMCSTEGFIKIMASDDEDERFLGMRAAGPQASSFIVSIAHIINQKNSIDQVLETIHPHPSMTEGIKDCLRVLKGKSIYKPEVFPHLIRTTVWKPKKI